MVDLDVLLLGVEGLSVKSRTWRPVQRARIASAELALAILDGFDRCSILEDQRQHDPLAVLLGGRADLTYRQILPGLGRHHVLGVIDGHRRMAE